MLDKLTIQSNAEGYIAPLQSASDGADQFKRIMEIDRKRRRFRAGICKGEEGENATPT